MLALPCTYYDVSQTIVRHIINLNEENNINGVYHFVSL